MINEIHVETWGCFIKCVRIGENPPWYIKCVPSTINEYLPKKILGIIFVSSVK